VGAKSWRVPSRLLLTLRPVRYGIFGSSYHYSKIRHTTASSDVTIRGIEGQWPFPIRLVSNFPTEFLLDMVM